MSGAKAKKQGKILKPGMLVLAAMFLWSAQHEPENFDPASVAGWVFGAVTVALLTCAAVALVAPVMRLLGAMLGQAMQSMQNGGEP